MTPQEYLAERREAAKRLDPETASVFRRHAQVVDPYGVYEDLPPELHCIGKTTFVSSPEEGVIWWNDLPDETIERLEERMNARNADVSIQPDPWDGDGFDIPF